MIMASDWLTALLSANQKAMDTSIVYNEPMTTFNTYCHCAHFSACLEPCTDNYSSTFSPYVYCLIFVPYISLSSFPLLPALESDLPTSTSTPGV